MPIQEQGTASHRKLGEMTYSQSSYIESAFSEADWEVVGAEGNRAVFVPQRFEVVKSDFIRLDPMFADYGGADQGVEVEEFREHQPKPDARLDGREGVGASSGAIRRDLYDSSKDVMSEEAAKPSISLTEDELQELLQKTREDERLKVTEELGQSFKQQLSEGEMRLQEALNDLSKQLNNEITRVEQSSVDLVLNIADKIVGASIEVNPEYILPIVKEAIALTGAATIKRILVGKDDFEFLTVLGFDRQFKGNGAGWNFELDDSIRMGCVVETSAGEVDYQLDQAWERVKEGLLKARA